MTDQPSGPIQRAHLGVSTLGHAISDGYVNFVPPLWHVVRSMFALTDASLGLVMMVFSLITNFGQPVFGYFIDRRGWRNVVGLGVLVGAVGTCFVGFMPGIVAFTAMLVFSGVGTALFHPQGGGAAAHASGARRALGMSIFGMGGAVGYAMGALASPLLHSLGLRLGMGPLQGFIFALPVGLVLAWVLHSYSRSHQAPRQAVAFHLRQHLLPYWRSLLPVLGVMVLRSMTVVAYASFYQVIIGDRGLSELYQGVTLFFFVFGGAIGGVLGAQASDLYGRRFVTVTSLLLSPPLLLLSLSADYWPAVVLLFLAGLTLRGAESVNIAQTQDMVPHGINMASSIGMGLAWGLAGIVTPIVGMVSDVTGNLPFAVALTSGLPVVAAAVAMLLPSWPPGHPKATTAARVEHP
ncbi:MAG TPA: hypothetical protein DGT21_10965 [Armatimonadetes bacterium]|nr:hypothetical protein [Armatimonadota bacterium]